MNSLKILTTATAVLIGSIALSSNGHAQAHGQQAAEAPAPSDSKPSQVMSQEEYLKHLGAERPKDFNPIKHISEHFDVTAKDIETVKTLDDGTIIVKLGAEAGGARLLMRPGSKLIEPMGGRLPKRKN